MNGADWRLLHLSWHTLAVLCFRFRVSERTGSKDGTLDLFQFWRQAPNAFRMSFESSDSHLFLGLAYPVQ